MPERSTKKNPRPRDPNQLAHQIMLEATGQATKYTPGPKEKPEGPPKNPAAVALGRLGGLKGGAARAASLSPRKRSQIAAKAAAARWGRKRGIGDGEKVCHPSKKGLIAAMTIRAKRSNRIRTLPGVGFWKSSGTLARLWRGLRHSNWQTRNAWRG